MIAVTGATGQLGRLVIEELLKTTPAETLVALARDPAKADDLTAQGVQVRQADYTQPETLAMALEGIDKLLLISSSEVGQRAVQHSNVIDAAKAAGVELIAYTSILNADASPLGLAEEHVATEAMLADSGVSYVLLRNGWYTENYMASVPVALQAGAVFGCAGEGRISSAARADYAAAAARVITSDDQAGKVYELAGDESYTLSELAGEIAAQSGKPVVYQDLPEADYAKALEDAGLPGSFAALLADSDTGASQGGLYDAGHQLSQLTGKPTTPMSESVRVALAEIG